MRKKLFQKSAIAFLVFSITISVFYGALFLSNFRKICYGVKVAGLKVGGLSPESAQIYLKKEVNAWLSQKIRISLLGKTVEVPISSLGISFDTAKMLQNAMAIGRKGNLLQKAFQENVALFGYYNFPAHLVWNDETLKTFSQVYYSEFLKESRNASLKYEDGKIVLVSSQLGRQPDWEKFKEVVDKKASYLFPFHSYVLTLKNVLPEVKDNETMEARSKAESILETAPFEINLAGSSWLIQRDDVGQWFKFEPVFERRSNNKILGLDLDDTLITNYLLNIVPQVNSPAKNARLSFKNGQIVIVEPSKPGIHLLISESADALRKGILSGRKRLELAVEKTPAVVSKDSLEKLGIDTLLGKGESDFSGSSLSRVNNIEVGAAKFDEHLLKPDEEFSFNKILGRVSGEDGYLPGLVIKDHKLVPEFGGGICQVSTTMFRAAVYAGLKVTERYPHSFAVRFYNPQGFDATVYPPHPDLRFINNTSGNILIQAKISHNHLIFEMYGKNEGRKVVVKGPYVYEKKDDGSMKTVLWQEVYDKNNKLLFKKGFWSYYKSPENYPIERNPLE